jgi:hypothetical protein
MPAAELAPGEPGQLVLEHAAQVLQFAPHVGQGRLVRGRGRCTDRARQVRNDFLAARGRALGGRHAAGTEVTHERVVIDRRDDLHAAVHLAVRQDHGIRTEFVPHLADRLADVGCVIAFDLHTVSNAESGMRNPECTGRRGRMVLFRIPHSPFRIFTVPPSPQSGSACCPESRCRRARSGSAPRTAGTAPASRATRVAPAAPPVARSTPGAG